MHAATYCDTGTLTFRNPSSNDGSREGRRHASRRAPLWVLLLAYLGIASIGTFTVCVMPNGLNLPALASPVSRLYADPDDWRLILVNDAHPIEPCSPELTQLRNGQAVDSRCYPDLQRMFDDARAAGLLPHINSSWRSREEQQRILDETIASYVGEGYSEDFARQKALRTVAEPGTSEHETGLAIDVTSELHTRKADKAVHAWMAKHSWEYGWILRYPAGKERLTGIDHETWHFRYVGVDAAREMHECGLCLEEYLGE